MGQKSIFNDKLRSVVILYTKRECTQILDFDAVTEAFATGHKNRRLNTVACRHSMSSSCSWFNLPVPISSLFASAVSLHVYCDIFVYKRVVVTDI